MPAGRPKKKFNNNLRTGRTSQTGNEPNGSPDRGMRAENSNIDSNVPPQPPRRGRSSGNVFLRIAGTVHQGSECYPIELRGQQCTAISGVALGVSKVFHVTDWTSATVDEILDIGNNLFATICQSKNQVESLLHGELHGKAFDFMRRSVSFSVIPDSGYGVIGGHRGVGELVQ